MPKPEIDFAPEETVAAVSVASQLIDQTPLREQRDVRAVLSCAPAFPHEPNVKVQKPRGMCECSDRMSLHRYSMLVDLVVESFAEGDGVAGVLLGRGILGMIWRKPKVETIKKVETR